jgi:hypothetical protein
MATMSTAPAFPKGEAAWTGEQANTLLRPVEDMFHGRDVDALVNGFTEGGRKHRERSWRGEVWNMRDEMVAFNVWEQGESDLHRSCEAPRGGRSIGLDFRYPFDAHRVAVAHRERQRVSTVLCKERI